jgi:uncharacterized repeat protein (TIGR01451 family)
MEESKTYMSSKRKAFRSWLLWTGLLVLLLGVAVLAGSSLSLSKAAAGPDMATEAQPAPASIGDVVTYTAYMPAVFRSFTFATLSVTKTAFPTQVPPGPGQVVTYTVTIHNAGDTTGTLRTVKDTLPAGFTFLGMDPSSDIATNPAGTSGLITWSGSWSMPPDNEMRLVYRVSTNQAAGTYENSVEITADQAFVPAQPVVASVAVQPAILMQDNFESGIDRWTAFLNYHRLEPGQWYWGQHNGYGGSGAITQDCCNGTKEAADALMMYLQPGAEDWTDYRVETKMLLTGGVDKDGNWTLVDGDPIGLWVRGHYQESDIRAQWVTGYYVVLAGKPDRDNKVVRLTQLQTLTDCFEGACDNPQNLYNFNNPYLLTEVTLGGGGFIRNQWYTLAVEVRGPEITVFLDGEKVLDYVDTKEPFLTGTVGFKTHETKTASFDEIIVTPLQ